MDVLPSHCCIDRFSCLSDNFEQIILLLLLFVWHLGHDPHCPCLLPLLHQHVGEHLHWKLELLLILVNHFLQLLVFSLRNQEPDSRKNYPPIRDFVEGLYVVDLISTMLDHKYVNELVNWTRLDGNFPSPFAFELDLREVLYKIRVQVDVLIQRVVSPLIHGILWFKV